MVDGERKYNLDWSNVEESMARLILRQGEVFLNAQLRVGLALDQRAIMISGSIITGFATAVRAATLLSCPTNSFP